MEPATKIIEALGSPMPVPRGTQEWNGTPGDSLDRVGQGTSSLSERNERLARKSVSAASRAPAFKLQLPKTVRQGRWGDPEFGLGSLAELVHDRQKMLALVRRDGWLLRDASPALRADKEIVLAAVRQAGGALEYASAALRNDREVVMAAVRNDGSALSEASHRLRGDREIVRLAIRDVAHMLREASPELRNDREIALEAVTRDGYTLRFASEELRNDREVVLAAVGHRGGALAHASPDMRDRAEVVLQAMQESPSAFQYASERLKGNPDFVRQAIALSPRNVAHVLGKARSAALRLASRLWNEKVKENPRWVTDAPPGVRLENEVVRDALLKDPSLMRDLDEQYLGLKKVVMPVVSQKGSLLSWVSSELQNDRELVLAAVQSHGRALKWASQALRKDEQLVLQAIRQHGGALAFADPRLRDKEVFVRVAVALDPRAYEFASERLRNNLSLTLLAVSGLGRQIEFASLALRAKREVALRAIRDQPRALQYVSAELKKDRELVLTAVRGGGVYIAYADPSLRADREIALEALRHDGELKAYGRLSEALRKDRNFVLEALAENRGIISRVPDAMKNEDSFLEVAADRDPLVLDGISSERRLEFLDDHPAIALRYQTLKQELGARGISFPSRLWKAGAVEEILNNRRNPGLKDRRPLAVVIENRHEDDPVFRTVGIHRLTKAYRVLYYQVDTDTEMLRAMEEATSGQKASLVLLGGHGRPKQLALGASNLSDEMSADEKYYLDSGDLKQLRAFDWAGSIASQAQIILLSCLTGAGRAKKENLANTMAKVIPQAWIFAPTVPTNSMLGLDAQGFFVGPAWASGSFSGYAIEPSLLDAVPSRSHSGTTPPTMGVAL